MQPEYQDTERVNRTEKKRGLVVFLISEKDPPNLKSLSLVLMIFPGCPTSLWMESKRKTGESGGSPGFTGFPVVVCSLT
jgi:hypothetical protein